MSNEIPRIESEPRQRLGSRYAARLRDTGRLPAVVYGHHQDPVHVSVDAKLFNEVLHGNAHLIEVVVDAKAEPCLVKSVQWDHLGSKIVHVDLARVDLSEEVEVEVELTLRGEPKAMEEAGVVLNQQIKALTVKCRADRIPQVLVHDISALELDQPLLAGEITLPEGVALVDDPETLVAQLTVVEELPEPVAAGEAGAEPEIIGREKGEGEEEEKE
jgi:large subunit ribosomal protein L25